IAAYFTPGEAFDAIGRVTEWWAKNVEGRAENLNDVFTVRFSGETFVTFEVTESVPGEKIVWQVTDCYLPWLKDKTEWNGTAVMFEISSLTDETQVTMTHIGLVPEVECFAGCEAGWNKHFKGSLFKLLTENVGTPQ
ncbi:MAG: SRPBCC domain-containing protein, partial [Bacteroidota bacterium]|nr:SRPBCC domain-containing protein [Bacteroidota bacterium]